eukprot:s630_g9.t1
MAAGPPPETLSLKQLEILAWFARLRYLNQVCSHPLLKATALSNARLAPADVLSLSGNALVKRLKLSVVPSSNTKEPPLLAACRAAQYWQGSHLATALAFTGLCRAAGRRVRLVVCFDLHTPLPAHLTGQTRQLAERLYSGGLGVDAAVALALEMEAKGLPPTWQKAVEMAAVHGYANPSDAATARAGVWVEILDSGSDWYAADLASSLVTKRPRKSWLYEYAVSTGLLCAADDTLKGGECCVMTDVSARYHCSSDSLDLKRTERVGTSWKNLQSWWKHCLVAFSDVGACERRRAAWSA